MIFIVLTFYAAEEIENANVVVPRAMILTVFINGFTGFGMLIAFCFSMGPLEEVLSSRLPYPFIMILAKITNSMVATTILVSGPWCRRCVGADAGRRQSLLLPVFLARSVSWHRRRACYGRLLAKTASLFHASYRVLSLGLRCRSIPLASLQLSPYYSRSFQWVVPRLSTLSPDLP
jgi:hypothetical protein